MTKTIITKPNNRPIWVAQEGTGGGRRGKLF